MTENSSSIEKRIAPQVAAEGLDSTHLDQVSEIAERVLEHVGEPTGNDDGDNKKIKKSAQLPTFGDRISRMLRGSSAVQKQLPSVAVQRKKATRALKKERRKLLRQIYRVQNKKNFSASALEDVVGQLRYVEELLVELVRAAASRVTELYKKFVRKAAL